MDVGRRYLDLLYAEAERSAYDTALEESLAEAASRGAEQAELAALREEQSVALAVREVLVGHRQREAELSALYETANDLIAIRDVDTILTAIVRRARQLLQADMTYLSLNDEEEGASYMKVTDGSVSAEFRNLRLPLGTGLLGLVAQTGAPYYTADYQSDQRFVHRDYIDHAVGDEKLRAILGVPLVVDGTVIGALLATHRRVRPFPASEVTLLTSFAAHAAVALQNAQLFSRTARAMAEVDHANRQIRAHSEAVEQAARAHDRLTDVLLAGGGIDEVSAVVADVLGGQVSVLDPDGRCITGTASPVSPVQLAEPLAEATRSGRSVALAGGTTYVVAVLAGTEQLGALVLHGLTAPLDTAERRTLERGALVTALVLLFARSVADAEDRVRGELLADLLSGDDADVTRLHERARRQRADLDRPLAVVVASVSDLERHRAGQVAARLAGQLDGLGGEQAGQVVLVAPADDALRIGRQLHERLLATGGTATVGVATAPDGLPDVAAAYAEARQCVAALMALDRSGEVSDPAGLGLVRLVLGDSGPAQLTEFVRSVYGPVLEYDARRGTDLMDTIEAWFGAGGSLTETATALHIHPNTVSQRLTRVGRLLGEDWREPRHALDQQLALRLWRLRGPLLDGT